MPVMEAFKVPPAAEADWSAFLNVFRGLRSSAAEWPAELEWVTRWYEPHLARLYDDAPVRQRDLVQLQQIASTYATRERFLTELALDPPDATSDEAGPPHLDDDYLILSTIHSAKGQEWKSVQILNVVDGCIPSDMSTGTSDEMEEERRLLYVAMTRAKDAAAAAGAAALLHAPAVRDRGSPRLRVAQPLHPGGADAAVRVHGVAGRGARRRGARCVDRAGRPGRAGRHRGANSAAVAMLGAGSVIADRACGAPTGGGSNPLRQILRGRHSRESGNPATWAIAGERPTSLGPRLRGDDGGCMRPTHSSRRQRVTIET